MLNKNYLGMTLNERLYESGLMNEFDKAVKKKDKSKLVEILVAVEIDEEEASETVDTILSNPNKYGHKLW